jgi:hypothetical protein
MNLIETTISEKSVRMRYADNSDPIKATEWIDVQVPVSGLKTSADNAVGDPQIKRLAIIQRAALRYVQEILSGESQGLVAKAD